MELVQACDSGSSHEVGTSSSLVLAHLDLGELELRRPRDTMSPDKTRIRGQALMVGQRVCANRQAFDEPCDLLTNLNLI